MYKKITHYIVEEHFDHPQLAALACNISPPTTSNIRQVQSTAHSVHGNVMQNESWYGNTKSKLTSVDSKLRLVNLDPLTLLFTELYSQWRDYVMYNQDLVNSVVNNIDNITLIEDRIRSITQGISGIFSKYYGKDVSDTIYKMMTDLNEIIIEIVKAEKSTGITDGQQQLATTAISNLVNYLHSINPDNWFKDPLNYIFQSYLSAMNDKIKSSVKKDWAVDLAADDRINQIVGNLVEALVKGIVEQFRPGFFPQGQ